LPDCRSRGHENRLRTGGNHERTSIPGVVARGRGAKVCGQVPARPGHRPARRLVAVRLARGGVAGGGACRSFAGRRRGEGRRKGGYQMVVDIMDVDQQLVGGKGGNGKGGKGKGGKGGKAMFGVDQYYLAIFGKPSATQPWMVQFGGHHLGINVTVVGKDAVLTPTHTGAQPTSFMRDGKTVRPLGPENDLAFKLVNLLDAKHRVQGPTLVIEYAPQGGTNHIHTVIRDPSNDYGKQLTKR